MRCSRRCCPPVRPLCRERVLAGASLEPRNASLPHRRLSCCFTQLRACVLGVELVSTACQCAMWVWDAGAPQLVIGVSRTGILPHYLIAYLFYTFAFPLCCFTHIHSRSTWLRAVKRVPCRVLQARMSPVMDGRDVSRGHCFTNGNSELQPSFLAMDAATSSVHAS
jgi:hypothetical protein